MRRARPLLLCALACAASLGCGSERSAGSSATTSGDVVVFAAASLTGAFAQIGDAFEATHPGMHVTFEFASSSDLVRQIVEGAPADVFASADESNMAVLTDQRLIAGNPRTFATNSLAIIVEPGNPKGIASLSDLARPDVVYVTCATQVPIGRYAAQALANAGVDAQPASLEENVKAIVTKVVAGEADAGIVYRTDVIAAGDAADGVEIPPDVDVTATYPVAALADAPDPAGAAVFVEYLSSAEARAILVAAGFGTP